jgi:hypothetical protein
LATRSVIYNRAPPAPVAVIVMLIKVLIVVVLAGIVLSLASGLFHLVRDESQSKKMVNALTVRIALSVALFILLFIAWQQGLIAPHGVR